MTGWNLPPGVTVGMIPGNRPEDEAEEKAMEVLIEKMDDALRAYYDNHGQDGLGAVTEWVEENFNGWTTARNSTLKQLRSLERAEQRANRGNEALNQLEAEGG